MGESAIVVTGNKALWATALMSVCALVASSCGGARADGELTCSEYSRMGSDERGSVVRTLGRDAGWPDAANPLIGLPTVDTVCGQQAANVLVESVIRQIADTPVGVSQQSVATTGKVPRTSAFGADTIADSDDISGGFPDGSSVKIRYDLGEVIPGSALAEVDLGGVDVGHCLNDAARDVFVPMRVQATNQNDSFSIPKLEVFIQIYAPSDFKLAWVDARGCKKGESAGSTSHVYYGPLWSNVGAGTSVGITGFVVIYDYFSPRAPEGSARSLSGEIVFWYGASDGDYSGVSPAYVSQSDVNFTIVDYQP